MKLCGWLRFWEYGLILMGLGEGGVIYTVKHMRKLIYLLLATFSVWGNAQEMPAEGEVIMISPKAPEAMVYVRKTENLYIGLEGDGGESVHSFVCVHEVIPNHKFYSEKYLLAKSCVKYLYDEPE
ncbi:MAG: hypothetical protein JXA04_11235 [Gammaproteobacteria bacterium]|nr:hypothetical protein [Gammaproteobacteria bacterium]